MNTYFLIAGILCLLLGVIHSILGEYLIFKNHRNPGKLVPTKSTGLRERHLRIIWATWHLSTLFGWSLGAMLLYISYAEDLSPYHFMLQCMMYAMFIGFLLVLIGTKGKHPGWFVLLAIGILLLIGS